MMIRILIDGRIVKRLRPKDLRLKDSMNCAMVGVQYQLEKSGRYLTQAEVRDIVLKYYEKGGDENAKKKENVYEVQQEIFPEGIH